MVKMWRGVTLSMAFAIGLLLGFGAASILSMLSNGTQLSGVITALVALFGLLLVSRQLGESIKANTLKSLLQIFNELNTKEARENRQFVYFGIKERSWDSLCDQDRGRVTNVWGTFDQIAYLTHSGQLDPKLILKMWGHSIKAIYNSSIVLLNEARKERSVRLSDLVSQEEARDYMSHFKIFAEEKCKAQENKVTTTPICDPSIDA